MSLALRLALVASATIGCTGAQAVDEDDNNGIYGSWTADSVDGGHALRLTLTSARSYSLEDLATSSSSSPPTGARVETGTFVVDHGTVTWTPQQSSCPGPDSVYQSAYALSGSSLSLALPSDIVVLHPARDADAGAPFTVGCFTANGTFTPSPLASVSN